MCHVISISRSLSRLVLDENRIGVEGSDALVSLLLVGPAVGASVGHRRQRRRRYDQRATAAARQQQQGDDHHAPFDHAFDDDERRDEALLAIDRSTKDPSSSAFSSSAASSLPSSAARALGALDAADATTPDAREGGGVSGASGVSGNGGAGGGGPMSIEFDQAARPPLRELSLSATAIGEAPAAGLSPPALDLFAALAVPLRTSSSSSSSAAAAASAPAQSPTAGSSRALLGGAACFGACALTHLKLARNNLTPAAFDALARAIRADAGALRGTLRLLDVSWNCAHSVGAVALVRALLPCPRFRTLLLSWNGVGDGALGALRELVSSRASLAVPQMGQKGDDPADDDGKRLFLDVSHNRLSAAALGTLRALVVTSDAPPPEIPAKRPTPSPYGLKGAAGTPMVVRRQNAASTGCASCGAPTGSGCGCSAAATVDAPSVGIVTKGNRSNGESEDCVESGAPRKKKGKAAAKRKKK